MNWLIILILTFSGSIIAMNSSSIRLFILNAISMNGYGHHKKLVIRSCLLIIALLAWMHFVFAIILAIIWSILDVATVDILRYVLSVILVIYSLLLFYDYFFKQSAFDKHINSAINQHFHPRVLTNQSQNQHLILTMVIILIEFMSNGLLIIATYGLINNFDKSVFLGSILFCLALVKPLELLLVKIRGEHNLSHLLIWVDRHEYDFKLARGVAAILLAWMLIMTANGTFNLG